MTEFTEPLHFKSGVTLRNRLFMSPMTTQQSFYNGTVTRDEIDYYTNRAGGVGAVITGAANVQDGGKGWPGELSIADDLYLPELRALAKGIQSKGAKAIIQIFHGGRMTNKATLSGVQTVSASAVPAERPDAETPRAMTVDEIHATTAAFGEATRRAIAAGFDGIELHGANTYLIQQFFSPTPTAAPTNTVAVWRIATASSRSCSPASLPPSTSTPTGHSSSAIAFRPRSSKPQAFASPTHCGSSTSCANSRWTTCTCH